MRAITFTFLAYVALALQLGLGPYIEWRGAQPNLVLVAAVFIGMNAAREPALLACFFLGLLQDILSGQALGVYAFSYGLAALLVTGSAQVVYRDHPLAHLSLVLAAAVIAMFVGLISDLIHPMGARMSFGTEFRRLLYTALLGPIVLWVIGRIRRSFAFKGSYRKRWGTRGR